MITKLKTINLILLHKYQLLWKIIKWIFKYFAKKLKIQTRLQILTQEFNRVYLCNLSQRKITQVKITFLNSLKGRLSWNAYEEKMFL